jgi:hypothetical protein
VRVFSHACADDGASRAPLTARAHDATPERLRFSERRPPVGWMDRSSRARVDARARENGCDWDEWTCALAAWNGDLECLKYACENGCPWNEETCMKAAENGHLECLKYAHENGCPWDKRTCLFAAYYGHLDCLKYAHENGCDWDEWTCALAAREGHLDCLKYAHKNGCPWDERTCWSATKRGHLECLKYACAHGCPGSDRYAEALNEVVIPDVDESFGVEVALAFQQNGGEISMREFLPLWVAHREGYRDAHLEVVRNLIAHDRLHNARR